MQFAIMRYKCGVVFCHKGNGDVWLFFFWWRERERNGVALAIASVLPHFPFWIVVARKEHVRIQLLVVIVIAGIMPKLYLRCMLVAL
jgi:hypothetical protein